MLLILCSLISHSCICFTHLVLVRTKTLTFHSVNVSFLGAIVLLFTSSSIHCRLLGASCKCFMCAHIKIKGYVTESSGRSSKPKKTLPADQKKRHRRSQSANGTNLSTMSARPLSRMNSMNDRMSRSKFRTPGNRLQTMSADRGVMNPVTPKIQMNTPCSLLRYPKVGETIISMSGSPVIVNG